VKKRLLYAVHIVRILNIIILTYSLQISFDFKMLNTVRMLKISFRLC